MDSKDRSTQKDTSSSAGASSPSLTPWEVAADEICKIAGGRVGALAREVAEQFYVEVMESTQDYLAENVAFNLASELTALKESQKRLSEENASLLTALRKAEELYLVGLINAPDDLCEEVVRLRREALAKATAL